MLNDKQCCNVNLYHCTSDRLDPPCGICALLKNLLLLL